MLRTLRKFHAGGPRGTIFGSGTAAATASGTAADGDRATVLVADTDGAKDKVCRDRRATDDQLTGIHTPGGIFLDNRKLRVRKIIDGGSFLHLSFYARELAS